MIQTPSLTLQPGEIGSHAFGAGAAGDLSILLGQLTLKDGGFIGSAAFGAGATASVQIRASDSITMSGFLPGTLQVGPLVVQNAGSNIGIGTFGSGQAGPVFVSTPTLTMNGANIVSTSLGPGGAGDVNIQAATIILTKGAAISTATFGSGPGGNVSVTASEQLSISGRSGQSVSFGSETAVNNPSAISAATFGTGRAGAVTVSTPRLTMFDDGLISTATGGDGPAGSIIVNAGSMNVSSGASISSSSGFNGGLGGGFQFGNGAGGTVTVNATGPVTIAGQGSGLFTTTVGNGVGGNIHLVASQVHLMDGASSSATSFGLGRAGDITINAGNQFLMTNSSITTEATQSGGGSIEITTDPSGTVQLTDSTISASVLDGAGGGGSVDYRSAIRHSAEQSDPGSSRAWTGREYSINITTNFLLPDAYQYNLGLLANRRERHHHDSIAECAGQRPDSAAGQNAAARDVAAHPTLRGPGRRAVQQLYRGGTGQPAHRTRQLARQPAVRRRRRDGGRSVWSI